MADRECFVCGAPVIRQADTGRIPRYCSEDHRAEARRVRAARERERQYAARYHAERHAFRLRHYGDAA